MSNAFDTGTNQLRNLDEQLKLLDAFAQETDDPLAVSGAEVLTEAKLEGFFELARLVDEDPDITSFCVNALQRVELINHVVASQYEDGLSDTAKPLLGQLATNVAAETEQLETFFDLFDPSNSYYEEYLSRKADVPVIEISPIVVEAEQVSADTSAADTKETAKLVEAAAISQLTEKDSTKPVEVVQDEGDKAEVDQEKSPDTETDASTGETEDASEPTIEDQEPAVEAGEARRLARLVRINGEREMLDALTIAILQHLHEAGGSAKPSRILNDPLFLENYSSRVDGVVPGRPALTMRANKRIKTLNEKFPGIIYTTGEKGGSIKHLNSDDYILEFVFDTPAQEIADEPSTAETGLTPELSAPIAPLVVEPPKAVQLPRQERQSVTTVERQTTRRTSETKITEKGYFIERRFTPFTPVEAGLIAVLHEAPRKQPLSAAHLGAVLRAQDVNLKVGVESVDQILRTLSTKLPEGWLIKEAGNDKRAAGWRFGSGIRVITQQNRKKKAGAKA